MKMLTIAGYLLVSIIIYSVLTKLADQSGRASAGLEKRIAMLALIWPIWGEVAILALVAYGIFSGLRTLNNSSP